MARFDCATWRPISVNYGGGLGSNYGLVLHHAVGNGDLFPVFNNPARKASTHFWVSKSGVLVQYVDTVYRCWGGVNLNANYIQVETEGCASPPHAEPMTEAMVNALGRLYAEGMRRHGWQLRNANAMGERGLGYHRMPGSGASTACICDERLRRRPDILARASGSTPAPKPPAPPPAQEVCPMLIVSNQAGGLWLIWGSFRTQIKDPTEATAYRNAGAREVGKWPDDRIAKFPIAANAVK